MRPIRVTKLINSMTQYRSRRKRNSMSHKAFPTCLPREHPRRKRMSRSPSMDVSPRQRFFKPGFSNPPLILSRVSRGFPVTNIIVTDWEKEGEKKSIKTKKKDRARFSEPWTKDRRNVEVRSIKLFDFLFFSATQPFPNPFLSFVS